MKRTWVTTLPMKVKVKTVKEAMLSLISRFPNSIPVERGIPDNFKELSYSEKFRLLHVQDEEYKSFRKEGGLYVYYITRTVVRSGRNIYVSSSKRKVLSLTEAGVKLENISPLEFRRVFGFLLPDYIPANLIPNSRTLTAILRGKVYSEETFWKYYVSTKFSYKPKNWRVWRAYFNNANGGRISILDAIAFTKDAEKTIEVVSKLDYYSMDKFRLLADLLNCAARLNEVVDFTWSDRRISEEHARQIREINREKIDQMDPHPVYEEFPFQAGFYFINNEIDAWETAERFHNCIHTCYWEKIKAHEYAVYIVTHDGEEAALGISRWYTEAGVPTVSIHQLYGHYNKSVSAVMRQHCEEFEAKYHDELVRLLDGKSLVANTNNIPF